MKPPKYQIGDRVKIKDKVSYLHSDHPAWKHAGTVMTVREVRTDDNGNLIWYFMEEDKKEYCGFGLPWLEENIAGFAEDFEDPIDDSVFPEITFEELLASTTLPERRTL